MKVGDKVAVLDDAIRGVITKVKDSLFFVKDEEGMEYQFLASELVVIKTEQHELTKYSDINNSLLRAKTQIKSTKKSAFKKQNHEVVLEVDLHAEKLIKSKKGLDNYDILTIQLDTAKHKLEFAIQKRIPKLVFIHGVGEGVLKTELKYLFNNYPVKHYDASYQKYGLGATEVYVYQNIN